jgi:hypothetical protein
MRALKKRDFEGVSRAIEREREFPSVTTPRGCRMVVVLPREDDGQHADASIERIPEPCPFCHSDYVAARRAEGIHDVVVSDCRTCEQEWRERVELPTVH